MTWGRVRVAALALGLIAVLAAGGASFAADSKKKPPPKPKPKPVPPLQKIKHFVVIYEENHSFDNLYGGWEGVDGLNNAPTPRNDAGRPGRRALHLPAAERRQPGVAAAARRAAPTRRRQRRSRATSPNAPFPIDDYIPPTATTCPPPGVVRARTAC